MMIQDLKKLLNSLKCPLCKMSIDIIDSRLLGYREYNYGCASNLDHYTVSIMRNDLNIYFLFKEMVNVYDKNHKYQLTKKYDQISSNIRTEILVLKIDQEKRVQFSFKNNSLILDKELFDFSKLNVDKVIERIKTILTFY